MSTPPGLRSRSREQSKECHANCSHPKTNWARYLYGIWSILLEQEVLRVVEEIATITYTPIILQYDISWMGMERQDGLALCTLVSALSDDLFHKFPYLELRTSRFFRRLREKETDKFFRLVQNKILEFKSEISQRLGKR